MNERYGWTGHNFPSEGYRPDSGSSVTWFRQINGKRFMFSAWIKSDHKTVSSIQVMDVTGESRADWTTRHMIGWY